MSHKISTINFRDEIAAQDEIQGMLTSGHHFRGKVYSCAADYFQIVTLELSSGDGEFKSQHEEHGLDIIRMRYDAVAYFDSK